MLFLLHLLFKLFMLHCAFYLQRLQLFSLLMFFLFNLYLFFLYFLNELLSLFGSLTHQMKLISPYLSFLLLNSAARRMAQLYCIVTANQFTLIKLFLQVAQFTSN